MVAPDTFAKLLADHCEYFAVLPDSRSAHLVASLRALVGPRVCQVSDEATAVGIAAGLTIANQTCLLIIESSGLRRGFETLGRLSGSHGIQPIVLATDRGAMGDSDWWAATHHPHARSVATALGASTAELAADLDPFQLSHAIASAVRHHRSQQVPVILWAAPGLVDQP